MNELEKLVKVLEEAYIQLTKFHEPDIDNQLTAIAISPSPEADELTKKLQLAGVKAGTRDKNTK